MEKDIEDIKSKTPPEKINEELKNLGYSDEGIQWCKAHEPAISSAMARISRQWKVVNHSNSIGKEWGIGILMLLHLSNLTLHDKTRSPGTLCRAVFLFFVYFKCCSDFVLYFL